jgi:integrase
LGGEVGFQDATIFDKAGLEKAGKSDVQVSASANPLCTICGSKKLFKNGLRILSDGSKVQRWLCRKCGYRFSDQPLKNNLKWQLNTSSKLTYRRRICATEKEAKNLAATETKTVAGEKEANLIEYAWQKKKKGVGDGTIRTNCSWLSKLLAKGADLNNPDSVETVLATEAEYNDKEKPSKKFNTVKAYKSYCKTLKIFWEPVKVAYESKEAFIATPDELKLYVNSAGRRFGAYLQVVHDTGARRGEVAQIKRCDVNTANCTISINRPEKGSRARTIKVQEATIARLQSLDRKYEPYIFNPNPNAHTVQFQKLRAKVCRLNPGEADRLTLIHIHTFRYGFAHRLMKQLKPQKEVQQKLGHKSSASTDRYTNTVVFNDLDWETARATTVEEAEALGKIGYTKYDVIGEVHLYRRLKA